MIGGRHHDRIARQIIDLKQQTRYDTLDLPRLVGVSPFFAQDIELVKKRTHGVVRT